MAAYAIQFRRGTTTEHNSFTGLLGEVTVDTTKKTVVVHDGSTAGGSALALEGAATNTTTGTYSSNVTVGGTLGVTGLTTMSGAAAVTGDLTMTGHILPSANITYDLGSATKMWKDIYVGPGSLYVNGKKVIEDDSGSINITTENNEDLKITTSGTGTLKLTSANGINLTGELGAVSGDLQIGDHIDMNSSLIKELATPVSSTDAANKAYVDTTSASAVSGGANAGSFTTVTTSGNAIVGGNLTVNGTTTSVNTSQIDLADNILLLNSDATGNASQNAGIEVERGDDTNVQLLWNETDNRWDIGGEDLKTTGDLIGDLTGDVTGTVSDISNHTTSTLAEGTDLYFTNARARSAISVSGDISYNSGTGVISTTGLASSDTDDLAEGSTNLYWTNARGDARIAAALLDEDNMASDSATHVASQQSIKAYVTSQIATKDNTDEMTEGSTNLYYTEARFDTSLATKSTNDLSEGTNKYYTDARADGRITNALKDEDNMASDSATHVASQQSIKAYVDAVSTAFAAADTADAAAWAAADTADAVAWAAADASQTTSINAAWAAADASQSTTINAAWAAADTAQTTALQSYADTAETDAIASAEAKDVARMVTSDAYADASEAAAIASAEAKDVARMVTSDAYADAAEAAAISTASADATTKANAAQAAAEATASADATAKVAVLTTGASAAFDTLVEIKTLMDAGDTTLTSSIAALNHNTLTGYTANEHIDWTVTGNTVHADNYTDTTYSVQDGQLSQINFTSADNTKLDGIEASADVTDATNVTAAGALMDSELTGIAHVKSLNQALTTTSSPSFTAVTATDFNGTATYAKYADLAERYAADATYEEGTVMTFGGEAEITSAQGYGSTKIAGVVSTNPGFAMNAEAGNSETHPYIALQGRVPCKVTGTVSKGDILVASEVSGTATKWLEDSVDPRMTAYVGIAIEDKTTDGEGYVEVKVGK